MTGSSVKTRLLMWLLPALALLVIAAAVGLYSLQRQLLYQEFDQQLARHAFAATRLLWRPPRAAGDEETSSSQANLDGLAFIELWDAQEGRLLAAFPSDHEAGSAPRVGPPPRRRPVYSNVSLAGGREVRILAMRMPAPPRRGRSDRERPDERGATRPSEELSGQADDEQITTAATTRPDRARVRRDRRELLYLAAADLDPLQAELRRWAGGLTLACAAAVAIVVLVVLIGVNRGLRPLRAVAADIATVDARHLARRVGGPGVPKEMRPVVRQLNELLGRLQSAFERERAFLAAAAHELRTPLAGLRSQIEVCLRRVRTDDEYRGTLAESLETAVSLQHIINSLLQISRLESQGEPPAAEPADAAALLAEQRLHVRGVMRKRRLRLDWGVPESLPVETDPQLFRSIVANLLANAADYAESGAWVRVDARREDDVLHVQVSNPVGTLALSDVDRLFDPFWRRDEARSEAGLHAGIGLAVVRQAVGALGGTVDATLNDQGVLRFDVRLPARPPRGGHHGHSG